MDIKKFLVSFLVFTSLLFLASTVSAYTQTGNLANIYDVQVNGLSTTSANHSVAVTAGDTITVKVFFDSYVDASNVRVQAEIDGSKTDVSAKTALFDVETDNKYSKTLTIQLPYELQDELSDGATLNVKVWNGDYRTDIEDINLNVQRASYNPAVMLISSSASANAGETLPVDITVKNIGYDKLNDVYVTAKITALNVEKTSYFGDLVPIENCTDECDNQDTATGRFYLDIPYDAPQGTYNLEVTVQNGDTTKNVVKQIVVNNDLASNVIKSGNNLIIVNPTNKVKVYSIVPDAPATASDSVVVVPAGSSKTVTVSPNAKGDYKFNVNVLSGETVVSTVAFTGTATTGTTATSPVVILTVVLGIIFLVLLVVLIILIGKKPEKAEEFGESYY